MMLFLLMGYMFLFIHRPFEVWPFLGELHIERLYALGIAGAWLVLSPKRMMPTRLDLALLLFLGAVLLAWGISPYGSAGDAIVEDWLKIVFFFALVRSSVDRPRELRWLLAGFLGIMAVYMLHSLWEFGQGRHTFRMGIARLIGVDRTLGDPNSFGASIVYALPFVRPFWLLTRRRLVRGLLIGFVGLSVGCVLLTGSRSALLGVIAWGAITSWQSRHRFRYLALGAVAGAMIFVLLPGDLQTRFESIVNPDVGPENARVSGRGRIQGLMQGWELWQRYPLTGCGPGAWRKATGSSIESHSLYGQLMGELGTLGIGAFALVLSAFVWGVRRLRRQTRQHEEGDGQFLHHVSTALATSLVLLLLEGFFGHNLFRFNWLWYAAFLIIALRLAKRLPKPIPWYHHPIPLGPTPGTPMPLPQAA
jgi:hypothetical protein